MSTISEAILRLFCRPIQVGSLNPSQHDWTLKSALDKIERVFPNFREQIKGKVVLDYGSGYGFQCIAMLQAGANRAIGLDIEKLAVESGTRMAAENNVSDRASFILSDAELKEPVDAVLSQNSFEHFPNPERELKTMASILAPGGKLFICFGPPWYAPYGSHMSYFCWLPWVNLLFSERTVLKVRSLYRSDGATRYVDVTSGLNMMSISKWEALVVASGLKVEYSNYHAVKNIGFLSKIPVLRELMINDVAAILVKPA